MNNFGKYFEIIIKMKYSQQIDIRKSKYETNKLRCLSDFFMSTKKTSVDIISFDTNECWFFIDL